MILPILLLSQSFIALAWITAPSPQSARTSNPWRLQATASEVSYQPLFDFANSTTVEAFDRIDDVIMGGISTSSMMAAHDYAKWFGVCRTDGGGFCGVRTRPWEQPLAVGEADGFYLKVRLSSDDEPQRRVWKMTTRVKPDRGEQLYQAQYQLVNSSDFQTVQVPFESFQLVRGPRTIPDGPPLNTTSGLYQIGFTMSKFGMGVNVTELPDFRAGFFELQFREIGLYSKGDKVDTLAPSVSEKDQRPLVVKVLRPISKLFFTEQSQRRKSAMKTLRSKRNLSRLGAVLFGLRARAQSFGWVRSIAHLAAIVSVDSSRTIALTALRVGLLYPLRLLGFLASIPKGLMGGKQSKKPVQA